MTTHKYDYTAKYKGKTYKGSISSKHHYRSCENAQLEGEAKLGFMIEHEICALPSEVMINVAYAGEES